MSYKNSHILYPCVRLYKERERDLQMHKGDVCLHKGEFYTLHKEEFYTLHKGELYTLLLAQRKILCAVQFSWRQRMQKGELHTLRCTKETCIRYKGELYTLHNLAYTIVYATERRILYATPCTKKNSIRYTKESCIRYTKETSIRYSLHKEKLYTLQGGKDP